MVVNVMNRSYAGMDIRVLNEIASQQRSKKIQELKEERSKLTSTEQVSIKSPKVNSRF